MNKPRRKRMTDAYEAIKDAVEVLNIVLEEEEESRYNTPVNLQTSDRYFESEEICDTLSSAIADLESGLAELEEICE